MMNTFNWRWVGCFSLVFFLVFGLKVGAWLDSSNLISLLIIFIRFSKQGIDRRSLYFFAALAIMAEYIALIIFINGAFYDLWHFFQIPRLLLNSLAIYYLVAYMSTMSAGTVERMLVLGTLAHSLLVIMGMFIPEVRDTVYSISGFYSKTDFRFAGLTQSFGITSVVHAFGILLVLFSKTLTYSTVRRIIYVSVILVSQIFLARIGLIFSGLFILVYVFKGGKNVFKGGKILILPIIFTISSLIFLAIYSAFDSFSPQIQGSINHSLQLWFYFSEDRSIQSLETIQNFIFHNTSFFEYIFGTGHFGRGDETTYLATDIAWAHMFSLGGFVFIAGSIFVYLYPLIIGRSDYSFILLAITLVILISNYKEAFVFTRSISSVWLFFVFLHLRALREKQYVR